MASSGPNAPGTLADDASVGTRLWQNPTNAASSNNIYSTVASAGVTTTSHYLSATNFGFSIPSGATIDGVVVEYERKANRANALEQVVDATVKLVIGGSVVGTNKNSATRWPTAEAFFTYGSSSDLWGNTITQSDVNSSNFGVVLNVTITNNGKLPSIVGSVDFVRMTIYYTTGASTAISKVINVGYTSLKNVGGVPIANIKKIINIT
jgi:hypothetical protein